MIWFINYFRFFANGTGEDMIGFVHYFLSFLLIWVCAMAVLIYLGNRGD